MMKINVQQLQHQQVTLNMKGLRHGLTRWGNYWAHQKLWPRVLMPKPVRQVRRGDCLRSFGSSRDNAPLEVRQFDQMIERLTPQCIRAIRAQYVCKGQWVLVGFDSKKSYVYLLRRAEIEIVGQL
jgi:hypothetical protein